MCRSVAQADAEKDHNKPALEVTAPLRRHRSHSSILECRWGGGLGKRRDHQSNTLSPELFRLQLECHNRAKGLSIGCDICLLPCTTCTSPRECDVCIRGRKQSVIPIESSMNCPNTGWSNVNGMSGLRARGRVQSKKVILLFWIEAKCEG
jgi:hypothetical protein